MNNYELNTRIQQNAFELVKSVAVKSYDTEAVLGSELVTFDQAEIEQRYCASVSDEDLIDFVDGQLHTVDDPIEVIYGNGHDKVCDFKPLVTSYGTVFCLTCESTVATLDALATKCSCGCFSTVHKSDGKCLSCGRQCA